MLRFAMDKQRERNRINGVSLSTGGSHQWYRHGAAKPLKGCVLQQHKAPWHRTWIPTLLITSSVAIYPEFPTTFLAASTM